MVDTVIPFLRFEFWPSNIKNYIITGLVSNFFWMHLVRGWHLLCRKEHTIRLCSCSVVIWLSHCVIYKNKFFCKKAYIHNWPLQPFSQDYGLASHTTHVVSFHFIHEWRDLKIFDKLFHGTITYSQSFWPYICWEEIAEEIFFSYFVLMSDLGYEPGLYLLDYGDFSCKKKKNKKNSET